MFVRRVFATSIFALSTATSVWAQRANEEEIRLSTVTVLQDRQAQDPGSYAFLDVDDVTKLAADHPAEALNTLPGVNIHMNSGQEHLLAIRSPVLTGGAGQGSFLILENGVPLRASAFGNVNMLIEPHHEVAEAIEVVRGPGSAKYGSNAVHGLINFILPAAFAERDNEWRFSASTLNRYKGDLIFQERPGNDLYLSGAISLQEDGGWRDSTGLSQQKGHFAASFPLGGWRADSLIAFSNLDQETGGFIQGPKAYRDKDIAESNPEPDAYREAWSLRGSVRLSQEFEFGDVSITPYARTQEMEFLQHFLPGDPTEENGHTSAGLMARVDTEIGETQIRYGATLDWADGYLTQTQDEPFGFFPGDSRFPVGTHYDYDVETLSGALWGEVETHLTDSVRILAGLRAETHEYDYTTDASVRVNGRYNVVPDRSDSFDLITPKLGFVWDGLGTDLEIYGNYARGERAPQASDLYRLQSAQIAGEIDVETLDSFELGIRGLGLSERLQFDVAAYVQDKDNFFFRDSDGLNVVDGKTEHIGVDAQANFRVSQNLSVSGQVSWSDQTYAFDRPANGIVDGNQIDTAPEWLADLAILWTPSDDFEVSFEAEYVGEYFTDEANTATYPGHTVFHARGSYEISSDIEAFLIVRNLFDLEYADRADLAFGNKRYFPGEPLNATFGVRKRF